VKYFLELITYIVLTLFSEWDLWIRSQSVQIPIHITNISQEPAFQYSQLSNFQAVSSQMFLTTRKLTVKRSFKTGSWIPHYNHCTLTKA